MSETKTPTPGTWQVVEDRDNGTDYYWITTKELLRHNPVDHEWAITNKADAYLIAASPAMAEALEAAGHLLNHFNTVVIAYLEGKLSKDAFISKIIPFSDGPERQRVAKLMNDALFLSQGM